MHGGSSPQVKAAAARRVTQAATEQAAVKYATPREGVTPSVALVEELRRAAGYVDWLEGRLRSGDGTSLTSVEWQMLGAERDRLTRLASDLARLGIEQTMLEGQVAQITQQSTEDALRMALAVITAVVADVLSLLGYEYDAWDTGGDFRRRLVQELLDRRAEGEGFRPQPRVGQVLPDGLRDELTAARMRGEAKLRGQVDRLQRENEALRARVQEDGLDMRLAITTGTPVADVPDVVDVPEPAAAVVVEPDAVIRPRRSSPRRVSRFDQARRSGGYRGPGL